MVLECNLCQDTFSIKPLRNRPSFLYSVPVLYLYLAANCMMTKQRLQTACKRMKEPNCAKREIISHTIFSQYRRLKQNFQIEAKVGLELLWYACCIHQNTKLKTNKNKEEDLLLEALFEGLHLLQKVIRSMKKFNYSSDYMKPRVLPRWNNTWAIVGTTISGIDLSSI